MTTSTSGQNTTGDQSPSTADVLQRARELIALPENWWKATRNRKPNQLCAIFAISEAEGCVDPSSPAKKAFCDATGIELGTIGNWNDAAERTHAEVIAAFDKAIERTRATGAA